MNTYQHQPTLQFLQTREQHQIAYAHIGNPQLPAILYLHGGPGSDANAGDAELFNLKRHSVVMFDQRGCGRSTPTGSIDHNTTQRLVLDIEHLRQALNIEQWKVYGGSWGAALALTYAKQFPQCVTEIILRGSFLARKQDLDWFIQPDGVAQQFPQAYDNLQQLLQPHPEEPLTSCLYRILRSHMSNDGTVDDKPNTTAYQAALAWDHWESAVMSVPTTAPETDPAQQLKRMRNKLIYAHYCHNQFFLGNDGVMPGLEKLTGIPVTLLHGRHDQVCPLTAAETLAEALPNARLVVVDAGHILQSRAMRKALWEIVT